VTTLRGAREVKNNVMDEVVKEYKSFAEGNERNKI
jgi:hypothetical protein